MENGYILLHRKMISEWEWYNNINDTRLWVHCLLKANWKKGFFEGYEIKRGSFVSSYEKLAIETGLTFSQIRKSLEHLKKSKNITITRHSRFSIITITNYEKYQIEKQTEDNHLTITSQSFSNNIINNNKEKELNNNMNIIINNWNKNLQCDEIAKTTNERCFRRSSYNINGKNYCNQHSKNVLSSILCFKEKKDKTLPDWFNKDFEKQNENIDELEDVLKEFK